MAPPRRVAREPDLAPEVAPFAHVDVYVRRMEAGLEDKLYFLRLLPEVGVFVDFGCADGALLEAVHHARPAARLVGVESSPEMLGRVRARLPEGAGFQAHTTLADGLGEAARLPGPVCLVLSSVVHEVYSYQTAQGVETFWREVFGPVPDYVALRDMALDAARVNEPVDPARLERLKKRADPGLLASFEARWGGVERLGNFIHFLLKARYGDNWARELNENYLPLTRQALVGRVPPEFRVRFLEHRVLPYLAGAVLEDFGLTLTEPTHLKLVLERG